MTWHFKADKVHDFAWAADPDYTHTTIDVPEGPTLHFFYQTDTLVDRWEDLHDYMVEAFQIMNKKMGQYPYKQYSFIQGGDGGMEYPNCTMITGHRSIGSLVGVSVHEAVHSWYQGMLATNEALYAWMDEGFTTWASTYITDIILGLNRPNPFGRLYGAHKNLITSNIIEPLTVHADHFNTNSAYSASAYSRGAVFLNQLRYIMGEEAFDLGLLRYYSTWRYRHPNPNDFIRVMEKVSGLELDWYLEHWVGSTNTIDYGIQNATANGQTTEVMLERIGQMPMPLDVVVTYHDGTTEAFHIPLRIMRGEKPAEAYYDKYTVVQDWPWVYPEYKLVVNRPMSDIKTIVIDPTSRLADIEDDNDYFPRKRGEVTFK